MTSEERKAQGWVECWGAVFDSDKGRCWWTNYTTRGGDSWTHTPKKRHDFGSWAEAAKWIKPIPSENVYPCRFWTRKRPKPAPKFLIGQDVDIRAKVVQLDDGMVRVAFAGRSTWVTAEDIVR